MSTEAERPAKTIPQSSCYALAVGQTQATPPLQGDIGTEKPAAAVSSLLQYALWQLGGATLKGHWRPTR